MGNLRWTPKWVTRTQTQIDPRSPQTMLQVENEYTGDDFSASVKVLNPSIMEGGFTAIVIGDYMQAITPRLSLGLEGVWQRASLGAKPETAMSYAARYKTPDWIAAAQIHASGQLGATYWRRLSEKVEAGVDCQLQFAPGMGGAGMFGGIRKEGQTTVGVKYNFATSVYRAQIDSAGKVGCVLEKRVAPAITFSFAAEIDQWKVRKHVPLNKCQILIAIRRTLTSSVSAYLSKAAPKNSKHKCSDQNCKTRHHLLTNHFNQPEHFFASILSAS